MATYYIIYHPHFCPRNVPGKISVLILAKANLLVYSGFLLEFQMAELLFVFLLRHQADQTAFLKLGVAGDVCFPDLPLELRDGM